MQLGGGAEERHAAVAEDVDAVGDLEDFADFLLDDQDGHVGATAQLAPKGIKRTLNLIEAAAPLSAEARRECESLLAAAFRSENVKEA